MSRTTSPHTSTGKTRLNTQHFAANRLSRKTRSREAQSGQSRLFLPIFFGFAIIPAELFILEENFCPLKLRSHLDASFPFIGRSLR